MTSEPEPKLAPPGAGLPAVELAVAKALFAWQRWTGNRRSFAARFEGERERVRTRLQDCPPTTASRRVLIRRVPGLEDSSRYWSVWMTLDHLRIVHAAMAVVIRDLTRGVTPDKAVSTAAVKPSADIDAGVVAAYEASCDALATVVATSPDSGTRVRFAHPWFGPLSAAGWHALAGVHLGIHRVQIERILAGTPTGGPAA